LTSCSARCAWRVCGTFHLDQLWPGVTDNALVSFLIYLVVFDFVDYWIHRGQHHGFNWWWSACIHCTIPSGR
jgi:sterol desaturase/sphingolipid hydroxylase (fatty acid hydroxylase superfamily)